MSVCALMLVKDEADVIQHTIGHLLKHVDEILILDNGSTDGTREILAELPVVVINDPEVAYYQDRKTTALAQDALIRGHAWALPCDADEWWYAPDGRPISDYLAGVTPDVRIVTGRLFNHFPTDLDNPQIVNPFLRLGWRQRQHGALPKVCCRTAVDLRIGMGNHDASYADRAVTAPGLELRHFSWRTADQYVRKIKNGQTAYAATDLPDNVGAHWRMFEGASDEDIADHFRRWFWLADPEGDDSMIHDPAPRP